MTGSIWESDVTPGGTVPDRQVLHELADSIRSTPDRYSYDEIANVQKQLRGLGFTGVMGANVPFSGTEADIPQPHAEAKPGSYSAYRANLPA